MCLLYVMMLLILVLIEVSVVFCLILVKLGRLSLGSAVKQNPKPGFDDLLSSVDAGGKNDYDW